MFPYSWFVYLRTLLCHTSFAHTLNFYIWLQTLDVVEIEVETCEDLRSMSVQGGLSSMGGGRYSFIHKVIDGMTVAVNTVLVTFRSPAFVASLQVKFFSITWKI